MTKSIRETADDLGHLKAVTAGMRKRHKTLEAILIDSGESIVEGDLFRVSVANFTRKCTAYKSICAKLKPSAYMLKTYTKISDVTCVKVKARKI